MVVVVVVVEEAVAGGDDWRIGGAGSIVVWARFAGDGRDRAYGRLESRVFLEGDNGQKRMGRTIYLSSGLGLGSEAVVINAQLWQGAGPMMSVLQRPSGKFRRLAGGGLGRLSNQGGFRKAGSL